MSELNYDSEGDSTRTIELRRDFQVQCVANAMTAGLVIAAMEKMILSRKKDRKDKAQMYKAKQLMEERVIETPPLMLAGGALKRDTYEVGGFSAEMVSLSKIPKGEEGDYHSNTCDDGAWSKSDANHPDTKVAGEKDACCKDEAYHPDEKVAGLVDMFSSESSPGAGTPSTEDVGEEDDILEKS
jgi:hypothetical protein